MNACLTMGPKGWSSFEKPIGYCWHRICQKQQASGDQKRACDAFYPSKEASEALHRSDERANKYCGEKKGNADPGGVRCEENRAAEHGILCTRHE